jgi:hypothetical protein
MTSSERNAIAEVLARAYNASPYRDAHLRGADAVLAWIQGLRAEIWDEGYRAGNSGPKAYFAQNPYKD